MSKTLELTHPSPLQELKQKSKRKKDLPVAKYKGGKTIEEVNSIKEIDMLILENGQSHLTTSYYLMRLNPPTLVLRRGKPFGLKLLLKNPINIMEDKFTILFVWKEPEKYDPKTVTYVTEVEYSGNMEKSETWKAICSEITPDGTSVVFTIISPDDAYIGLYTINIHISFRDSKSTFSCDSKLMVLFNAWNPRDPVYLENNDQREEFVLEDKGVVFRGTAVKPVKHAWNFHQYYPNVILASIAVATTLGKINADHWGNPLLVAKHLGRIWDGIMTHKPFGPYDGGVHPEKWSGSGKILQKWYQTKSIVKFGHTFCFAGVYTTMLRSLGIPSRSTTCYHTGREKNNSCIIGYIYDDASLFHKIDSEEFWYYQVWNEMWTKRIDYPQYSGWQALDSKKGPSSLLAIKNQDLGIDYNTILFYGYSNSVLYTWIKCKNKTVKFVNRKSTIMGDPILTLNFNKKINLTDLYKHEKVADEKEVAEEEKKATAKYPKFEKVTPIDGFTFQLKPFADVNYGQPFTVGITLLNKSKHSEIEAKCILSVFSCLLNNESNTLIKKLEKDINIQKGKGDSLTVEVLFDEYREKLLESWYIKVYGRGTTTEPVSEYLESGIFQIQIPELKIKVEPKNPKMTDKMMLTATFTNPTTYDIKGNFYLEESDTENVISVKDVSTISPKNNLTESYVLVTKNPGAYKIKIIFTSEKLITSSELEVNIKP